MECWCDTRVCYLSESAIRKSAIRKSAICEVSYCRAQPAQGLVGSGFSWLRVQLTQGSAKSGVTFYSRRLLFHPLSVFAARSVFEALSTPAATTRAILANRTKAT